MSFFKSLSVYTLTNIFNSGIAFFLLPVYTHYLSPADYGILSIFTLSIAFVTPFIHLAVNGAIRVEYFKLDQKSLPSYISSSLLNNVVAFIICLLLGFFLSKFIGNFLEIPASWVWAIPVIASLQLIPLIVLVIFQVQHKAVSYSKFNISQSLLNLLLGIVLVVVINLKWEGRILSLLSTNLIFSVIGIIYLSRQGLLTSDTDKEYRRSALFFGLPLIFHALSAVIIDFSDRIFITKMVGVTELGIYNVGYQVAMIIAVLESSFVQAYVPVIYENLKLDTYVAKVKIVKLSYIFIAGLFLAVILLYIVSPIIFKYFIGAKFAGGIRFVFLVALSYFFSGIYKMFVGMIFYFKKTQILTYISILNILLNFLFNYLFIKDYGTIGAAYATALSYFIVAVLIIIISTRVYKMPWLNFYKNEPTH